MYVCLCRRVSDTGLRAAIAAGARDVEAIRRACGASSGCGGCRPLVEAMLVAAGVGLVGDPSTDCLCTAVDDRPTPRLISR